MHSCLFPVPVEIASVELLERTDTSLSITWAEPSAPDLAGYDVSISPNDNNEVLPIRVT